MDTLSSLPFLVAPSPENFQSNSHLEDGEVGHGGAQVDVLAPPVALALPKLAFVPAPWQKSSGPGPNNRAKNLTPRVLCKDMQYDMYIL